MFRKPYSVVTHAGNVVSKHWTRAGAVVALGARAAGGRIVLQGETVLELAGTARV